MHTNEKKKLRRINMQTARDSIYESSHLANKLRAIRKKRREEDEGKTRGNIFGAMNTQIFVYTTYTRARMGL